MTKQLEYQLKDGTTVPLFEADYDTAFKVFKSDRKKSVIADPLNCIEAKGLCRLPNVIEAYIGSGKDAYVVYKSTPSREFPHAVHFTIPASSAKVRDAFETKRDLKSQTLMLKVPSKGRTLKHRRTLNKARHAAIKNGAPIKKRSKAARQRVHRLGVDHRPRAMVKAGVVTLSEATT
jgi:hypothetical protein